MSVCGKCSKDIYGDDLYEIQGKVYCDDCARTMSQDSSSSSPTGIGCIGSYVAAQRPHYFKESSDKK